MRLAGSGYTGGGKVMAVPLRTPPETGFRIGLGAGLGGGSPSRLTIGAPEFEFTATVFTSTAPGAVKLLADTVEEGNAGEVLRSLAFPLTGFVSTLALVVAGGGFVAAGSVAGVLPGVTIFTMFSSR